MDRYEAIPANDPWWDDAPSSLLSGFMPDDPYVMFLISNYDELLEQKHIVRIHDKQTPDQNQSPVAEASSQSSTVGAEASSRSIHDEIRLIGDYIPTIMTISVYHDRDSTRRVITVYADCMTRREAIYRQSLIPYTILYATVNKDYNDIFQHGDQNDD